MAIIFSFKVRGLTLVYKAFVWFFIRHLPTGIPFCSSRSKFQLTLLSELPFKLQYWRDRNFKMNTIFYKVHVWHWSENVTFHGKVLRLTNDGTKTCEMNFDNLNKSTTCNDISSQLFYVYFLSHLPHWEQRWLWSYVNWGSHLPMWLWRGVLERFIVVYRQMSNLSAISGWWLLCSTPTCLDGYL